MAEKHRCPKCNSELVVALRPDVEGSSEAACVSCGAKVVFIQLVEQVAVPREDVRGRARAPGEKKPRVEVTSQDSEHRATGEIVDLDRRIDRRNDWYDEVVKTKDGKVLHETHEPLKKHQGHGSARTKKRPS